MSKNYLLIYSEQLATEIVLLYQNIKAPSNTFFKSVKAQAAYMLIFVKPIMVRVKLICFQSLKSLSKNVMKQRGG